MLFSYASRTLLRCAGVCCLLTIHPSHAIETKRNCAVSLSNDHFVVLSGFQGSVMDVLANDSGELDASTLVTVGQSTAAGGSVFVVDGEITYSPPPNFSGEDSFTYQVSEIDWRAAKTAVAVTLSDAGAPPSISATGTSVIAAPSLDSGSDWQAGVGLASESIFGRQVKVDADYTGCYQDSDPKFELKLQWLLTKRSGSTNPANEFEASISPLANHPGAALASQAYAWPASSSRQLSLSVSDLVGSQLQSFRAGLFAQARDSYGDYRWRSGGVQASATLSTSHCELCNREARVTITVDTDSDGDGVSDSNDADDDNDGIPDALEGRGDADGDGLPNHQDLDSDNDGLMDLLEAGGVNSNGSGRLDDSQDADGDGLNDLATTALSPERDSDGDGILDFLDLDSDNDGTPDLVEQGYSDRAPRDGRVDGFRDANGDGAHDLLTGPSTALDTDNDGEPNVLDLDSDNDKSLDTVENELTDFDTDLDGQLDALQDRNDNGVIDAVDVAFTGGTDINQNGIDDDFDAGVQLGGDQDGDSITDGHDPDLNGDGWLDAALQRNSVDADGSGTVDYLQSDFSGRQPDADLEAEAGSTRSATAGIDGYGGCSLNPEARFDPLMWLMLLIAAVHLGGRSLRRSGR